MVLYEIQVSGPTLSLLEHRHTHSSTHYFCLCYQLSSYNKDQMAQKSKICII